MQKSFADLEYAAKKRLTRRDRFLGELEILVPWVALCAEIDPFYLKTGQCFGKPDEGIEAPSSTKNRQGERDPQMHQTRKGKKSTIRTWRCWLSGRG
jgi:hypothetical protein